VVRLVSDDQVVRLQRGEPLRQGLHRRDHDPAIALVAAGLHDAGRRARDCRDAGREVLDELATMHEDQHPRPLRLGPARQTGE